MTIPVVRQAPWNPRAASENRKIFDASGVICLNLIGATGCGKTSILEAILPRIQTKIQVGVIEGDLASTCDALRIGALGVPVVQILTDDRGQLGADQVQRGLAELPLGELDLLMIENVGSPISQADTDLGEHLRMAVLSISGGAMVATKYPLLFRGASVVLLTKYDLLPHVDFDLDETVRILGQTNPHGEIICTDTKNRVGIDRLAGWLLGYVRAQRMRDVEQMTCADLVGSPT